MKLKKILLSLLSILFCTTIFSQDKISVIINNKMMGERVITEDPIVINASRKKYKNIYKLVLKYTLQNASSPFKRSIEITNGGEDPLYTLNESKGGIYNINIASIKKKLMTQKVIKVFLMENPANDRMAMPSRRKLLIELHLK